MEETGGESAQGTALGDALATVEPNRSKQSWDLGASLLVRTRPDDKYHHLFITCTLFLARGTVCLRYLSCEAAVDDGILARVVDEAASSQGCCDNTVAEERDGREKSDSGGQEIDEEGLQ